MSVLYLINLTNRSHLIYYIISYTGCIFPGTRRSDQVLYKIYHSWNQMLWSSLSYTRGVIPETRLNLDLINLINLINSIKLYQSSHQEPHQSDRRTCTFINHNCRIHPIIYQEINFAKIQKLQRSIISIDLPRGYHRTVIYQSIYGASYWTNITSTSSHWDYSLNQHVITPHFKEGQNVYT